MDYGTDLLFKQAQVKETFFFKTQGQKNIVLILIIPISRELDAGPGDKSFECTIFFTLVGNHYTRITVQSFKDLKLVMSQAPSSTN